MKNLAKQDLRMVRGRTAQSQLLAAGERPLGYRAVRSHGLGIENKRRAPRRGNFGSLLRAGKQAHAGAPCAPPLRGGAVYRLVSFGRRTIDDHYFGRVVARKGVKQRFPELVEKEYLLVDVDFIGPILDQSGKEFSQIFLGR